MSECAMISICIEKDLIDLIFLIQNIVTNNIFLLYWKLECVVPRLHGLKLVKKSFHQGGFYSFT